MVKVERKKGRGNKKCGMVDGKGFRNWEQKPFRKHRNT
jgi:hypothetical protein